MTIPLNSNGHRRRQLRARVLAEETHCAICGKRVDKTLKVEAGKHYKTCDKPRCKGCKPHQMRAEVDEDRARAHGGSPHDRSNCHLTHRACNQAKGTLTLEQARNKLTGAPEVAERQPVQSSPIW